MATGCIRFQYNLSPTTLAAYPFNSYWQEPEDQWLQYLREVNQPDKIITWEIHYLFDNVQISGIPSNKSITLDVTMTCPATSKAGSHTLRLTSAGVEHTSWSNNCSHGIARLFNLSNSAYPIRLTFKISNPNNLNLSSIRIQNFKILINRDSYNVTSPVSGTPITKESVHGSKIFYGQVYSPSYSPVLDYRNGKRPAYSTNHSASHTATDDRGHQYTGTPANTFGQAGNPTSYTTPAQGDIIYPSVYTRVFDGDYWTSQWNTCSWTQIS